MVIHCNSWFDLCNQRTDKYTRSFGVYKRDGVRMSRRDGARRLRARRHLRQLALNWKHWHDEQ